MKNRNQLEGYVSITYVTLPLSAGWEDDGNERIFEVEGKNSSILQANVANKNVKGKVFKGLPKVY